MAVTPFSAMTLITYFTFDGMIIEGAKSVSLKVLDCPAAMLNGRLRFVVPELTRLPLHGCGGLGQYSYTTPEDWSTIQYDFIEAVIPVLLT
jgi:hypothetical protein